MKVAVVVLALVACVCANSYTTKYDNIDLDQILQSDRLLKNYVNCLLGVGNCTPDGNELKKALPDALASDCLNCSEKQRLGSEKVIRFLVNERPQVWAKLAEKYDPNRQYQRKFEVTAAKAGIKL
ncbi:ejaculatory bulb-specific protein 3 [Neodiprion fabricii]|uniref:ejaculatory bulb-specific protein 3 n=1 Tax=Neodiprion fabricii TaxID=2872261 RepID=UPI001ED90620|nr:ejaculatory bulb-specific protein 3 [Neodiprion fabricii]